MDQVKSKNEILKEMNISPDGCRLCQMLGIEVFVQKCMFCSYGHMTECHFPDTCDSDACHHYDDEPDYDY